MKFLKYLLPVISILLIAGAATHSISIDSSGKVRLHQRGGDTETLLSEGTHYETGTFDTSCGNCTAGPYTFEYTRIGEQVCLTFPTGEIVLASTSFPIFVGMPASIRAASGFRTFSVLLTVNGTRKMAYSAVYSADRLDLYEDWLTADTSFPSGATIGFGGGPAELFTTCYIR